MNFILRWLGCAIAVACAVWLVPGIDIVGGDSSWMPVVLVALFLALINVSIKPLMQVLSLPITVLTLGIFYLVVNALMLELASWCAGTLFAQGIYIETFGSAFVASIIISIVSSIVNGMTGANS